MKRKQAIILGVVLVLVVCGLFAIANMKKNASTGEKGELTEVEKIVTKDLENNYPASPREVIKLYNRIIHCYYSEDLKEDELDGLCSQALMLFDDELRANNPKSTYVDSVKADINEFKKAKKVMTQYDVCDSNDVQWIKDTEDELAYVEASYFIKEKETSTFTKTYQTYVLRKDDKGNWKIIAFYQTDGSSKKDDER